MHSCLFWGGKLLSVTQPLDSGQIVANSGWNNMLYWLCDSCWKQCPCVPLLCPSENVQHYKMLEITSRHAISLLHFTGFHSKGNSEHYDYPSFWFMEGDTGLMVSTLVMHPGYLLFCLCSALQSWPLKASFFYQAIEISTMLANTMHALWAI